jgi:hypothetical protein
MPTVPGSLESTGPNSYTAVFDFIYKGTGTVTPALPSWSVPKAELQFDGGKPPSPIPFSGTIGPTTINISSTVDNATLTGLLVPPIDNQYDVSGTLAFNFVVKPGSYSTISVYIAFTNFSG